MIYFYAPSFTFTNSRGKPAHCPGVQVDDAIEAAAMPPGARSAWFDAELPRFVIALPVGTPAPGDGWENKTAAEVLADYPDADVGGS